MALLLLVMVMWMSASIVVAAVAGHKRWVLWRATGNRVVRVRRMDLLLLMVLVVGMMLVMWLMIVECVADGRLGWMVVAVEVILVVWWVVRVRWRIILVPCIVRK